MIVNMVVIVYFGACGDIWSVKLSIVTLIFVSLDTRSCSCTFSTVQKNMNVFASKDKFFPGLC